MKKDYQHHMTNSAISTPHLSPIRFIPKINLERYVKLINVLILLIRKCQIK